MNRQGPGAGVCIEVCRGAFMVDGTLRPSSQPWLEGLIQAWSMNTAERLARVSAGSQHTVRCEQPADGGGIL
jgi:hypothetical protein